MDVSYNLGSYSRVVETSNKMWPIKIILGENNRQSVLEYYVIEVWKYDLKATAHQTAIRQTLLYESESWTYRKDYSRKIGVA